MLVPIPKPPTTAMTSMVSHQAAGKSPLNSPVKANTSSRHASPISTSRAETSAGPPTAETPTTVTSTMAKMATMPCRKSPITTPQ